LRRSRLRDGEVFSETVLSQQRTLWRSVGGSAAIIPADGCVDFIVRGEQVLLCGPQTRVIHAPADDVHPTVGLKLEAGTARRVLPVALSELRNRVVELRTALGSEATVLYDLMMRASITLPTQVPAAVTLGTALRAASAEAGFYRTARR
jgi:hypothetical protein